MNVACRYIFLVLAVFLCLYSLYFVLHDVHNLTPFFGDGSSPPLDSGTSSSPSDLTIENTTADGVNAVIVMLARNEDAQGIASSMKQLEWSFNNRYNYPYVFLNDKEFTEEFKSRISVLTSAKVEFGLIPSKDWLQPPWIDEEKAAKARKEMSSGMKMVPYGGSLPYRNMCRFNSGFFYRHELLKKYKYYWRVEPGVKFFCDINYDPFKVMRDGKKVYGFTISLFEYGTTIPTLWDSVKEFIRSNPQLLAQDNAMDFLSDNKGETYNLCHFWSNFEIGDLDFWRGEAYSKFFDFLDKKGGFYYERWGDAPVHSIGAALFAQKDQIHFFDDIGYRHEPYQSCPSGNKFVQGKCSCDQSDTINKDEWGCTQKFLHLFKP